MIDLILKQGGVSYVVQVESSTSIKQSYSPIGGYATRRFMNGGAFKQSNWKRLATVISGSGHVVDAIDGIDWDLPVELWCVGERSLESVSNAIALPTYRADAPVTGFAIVGGRLVESPVSVSEGGVATVTTVAGATRYKVVYFPKMTVYMEEPERDADYHEAEFSWSIKAEEV
jgi:hypothetical protein